MSHTFKNVAVSVYEDISKELVIKNV